MSATLLLYPIFVPLVISVLLLFFWRRSKLQRRISFFGNLLNVYVSVLLFHQVWTEGILIVQSGNWQAPFGISFVGDTLTDTLVLLTSIVGLLVGVFAIPTIGRRRISYVFFPIFHFLMLCLNVSILIVVIFIHFFWFCWFFSYLIHF